ncbi:sulfur carrier protein ThiS [Dysgonomonas sp. 216]|uniref:sulfur carrier protein ThiS n=1 Tax=Dysgonomonas sp. 216 TaxID=2302934 RepID=UPI0013D87BD1|nr:sulfur carrier protein ThiS [Dysgonomonas sp. 216]NDW19186.1 sulfur carrier protein ThiS [Dysgonomonas sp. 216]
MNIKLNDKLHEIAEGTSLANFINSLNVTQQGIAVAINYEVIPKDKWVETILTDNMELMLIHAVSGG